MPFTAPNSLTLADSDVLYAGSHWNRLVENVHSSFVTAVGCALEFHSAGAVDVATGYQIQANYGQIKVQEVFASRYATSQANSLAVFSTFLVASITPKFSDSVLHIRGEFHGQVIAGATEICRVNLCRDPNGTPVVLTNSTTLAQMDRIAGGVVGLSGEVSMTAIDCAQTGAIQYGIRFAATTATVSEVRAQNARLHIEEYR